MIVPAPQVLDYEAVHRMEGWGDLRQRLGPCRRIFAFFHQVDTS